MSFRGSRDVGVALKVGVGNINALTGQPWEAGKLTQSPQNYVVLPNQPWLDGVVDPESDDTSLVRQVGLQVRFFARN